jgi:WXG100 family type VII secretion target
MSDGRLLVQFGALETASENITRAISALNNKLADLEHDAQPLIRDWDGAAQLAYAQRQQAWRKSAEDITLILGQINKALQESAQHYQATERANTNLFS